MLRYNLKELHITCISQTLILCCLGNNRALSIDLDIGVLCVSRDLAHELGHPWAEYWDFLDSFVDLQSNEGLKVLEEYLSKKDFRERAHEEAGENETSNRFKTPSPGKTTDS